ncbi:DUF3465 domain-containing protein [Marinobacterium sp. YM272]|uniref:DUF3465 domain-containing protein n=1 Tax=Marinobacterium sp. YM272 TaxID=3421654 RepID=UPI003D7FBB64
MKKLLIVLVVGVLVYGYIDQNPALLESYTQPQEGGSDARLAQAYEEQLSDLQVAGAGEVVHLLPDDNQGSRHQKFILRLATGQTLLISHNIDLAPRIDSLREGDRVEFYGEYEWNPKGGVVHWTHHDPRGRHEGGWLKHRGVTYQ